MRTRFNASLSLLALASAAFSTPAFAQDTANEAVEADASTDVIVVTARRREERLQDVPVAVSALSGDSLVAANVVQVQDVQQRVPGLTIQSSAFGSNVLQVSIRGQRQFDPYITKDPAVAVYFADVVQNRPQGLNAGFFDIQSVQVLKGPQGTLFGRNTTGGAMIITPVAPSTDFEGYVTAGIGNYESRRLEGAINLPLTEWAQIRAAGQLQRRDGFTKSVTTGQLLDDEHKDSWRVSLRLSPGDGSFENRTVVSGFRADENGIGYKLIGVIPGIGLAGRADVLAELARNNALPFHSTTADLFMETKIKTFAISNVTEYTFSDAVKLRNIAGYRTVDSHIPFDLDGSTIQQVYLNGPQQIAPSREDMHVKQYSDELQLLGTVLDGSLDYILGGYYFLEKGRDLQSSGGLLGIQVAGVYQGNRVTYADPIRNEAYSGFAQATWRPSFVPGLSLTAGGRQNHDKRALTTQNYIGGTGACRLTGFSDAEQAACAVSREVSYNEFTYTLSADYKITPDLMVYIAHRKGYRTGGFNISATSPAQLTPFRPEIVKDIEAGIKSSFRLGGGKGTLNIAAYTQDYNDIQRNQGFFDSTNTFVQTIVNAASARIKGFEVELDLHPDPLLDFGVNVSHIDAQYLDWSGRDGEDLTQTKFAGTPKWTISSYAQLNIPAGSMGELGIRGDIYHQTDTNNSDQNWLTAFNMNSPTSLLEGYTLVNGRIELRDVGGTDATISLWGKNLFNAKYYAGGTDLASAGFGFSADFLGAPRTYGVEVRYQF